MDVLQFTSILIFCMGGLLLFFSQKLSDEVWVKIFWRRYVKWYSNLDLSEEQLFPLMRQAQIGKYLFFVMGLVIIGVGLFLLSL